MALAALFTITTFSSSVWLVFSKNPFYSFSFPMFCILIGGYTGWGGKGLFFFGSTGTGPAQHGGEQDGKEPLGRLAASWEELDVYSFYFISFILVFPFSPSFFLPSFSFFFLSLSLAFWALVSRKVDGR
ncbi:hypothetical protein LX36DRAFT_130667 [Colletotrichum falcatum]|nr:hypothetical protein LX36DRAFT_130667 [Colletotrichum falcatum]